MDITIKMKDGTVREFKHEGRAGGSYTKRLSYEWDKQTAIPTADIAEIVTVPRGGRW